MNFFKYIVELQLQNFEHDYPKESRAQRAWISTIRGKMGLNLGEFLEQIQIAIEKGEHIDRKLVEYLQEALTVIEQTQAHDRAVQESFIIRGLPISKIPFLQMRDLTLEDLQEKFNFVPSRINLASLPYVVFFIMSFYYSGTPTSWAWVNIAANLGGFIYAHERMKSYDRHKIPVQGTLLSYWMGRMTNFSLFGGTSPEREITTANLNNRENIPFPRFNEYLKHREIPSMTNGDLKQRLTMTAAEAENGYYRDARITKDHPWYQHRTKLLFGLFYGIMFYCWSLGFDGAPGLQYFSCYLLVKYLGEWLVNLLVDASDLGTYSAKNISATSSLKDKPVLIGSESEPVEVTQTTTSMDKIKVQPIQIEPNYLEQYWRVIDDVSELDKLQRITREFLNDIAPYDVSLPGDKEAITQKLNETIFAVAKNNIWALNYLIDKVMPDRGISKKNNPSLDWVVGRDITHTQSYILKKAKARAYQIAELIETSDKLSLVNKKRVLGYLLNSNCFINTHAKPSMFDPARFLNPNKSTNTYDKIKLCLDRVNSAESNVRAQSTMSRLFDDEHDEDLQFTFS